MEGINQMSDNEIAKLIRKWVNELTELAKNSDELDSLEKEEVEDFIKGEKSVVEYNGVRYDMDSLILKAKKNTITQKICSWAYERQLHNADGAKQLVKLMEEVGELASAFVKNKPDQVIDAIGDIYVVLTIFALQQGLSVEDCIFKAYEEIKDRKGKMVNGIFIKEDTK